MLLDFGSQTLSQNSDPAMVKTTKSDSNCKRTFIVDPGTGTRGKGMKGSRS